MTRFDYRHSTVAFVVGVAVAAASQATLGWWLDSGTRVAIVVATLFVSAAALARATSASRWGAAASLWAGAMVTMTTVLFWIGPGTIWPIVLVVAAMLTAAAIASGTFVGKRRVPRNAAGPPITGN